MAKSSGEGILAAKRGAASQIGGCVFSTWSLHPNGDSEASDIEIVLVVCVGRKAPCPAMVPRG